MKILLLIFLSLSIGFQSVAFERDSESFVDESSHSSSSQDHNSDAEIEDTDDLEEEEFHVESSYIVSKNIKKLKSLEKYLYKTPFLEEEFKPPRV